MLEVGMIPNQKNCLLWLNNRSRWTANSLKIKSGIAENEQPYIFYSVVVLFSNFPGKIAVFAVWWLGGQCCKLNKRTELVGQSSRTRVLACAACQSDACRHAPRRLPPSRSRRRPLTLGILSAVALQYNSSFKLYNFAFNPIKHNL